MSTQQDIYAADSKNHPPMLNKDNYVPWSSRILRYAKSKPHRKLLVNSILYGPYTDDELTKKEAKQMEADDQSIQTILMGLPKDIYAAVDSCDTAQEIWLRVEQMMKGSDIGAQEKKAKLFNEWEKFNSTKGESIESYYHHFAKLMNDFFGNKHFSEKIASNLKFLNHLQPEWKRHVTTVHQTKILYEVDYNQLYDFLKMNREEVNEIKAERLAKTHDPLALMANSHNPYNYLEIRLVQNPNIQNVGNQNGLIIVLGIANQNANKNENGNVVAARAKGNGNRNNEEAGIQLQAEEFDLMATACDIDEIEEVNANCILMANLQQASASGTQTDKAPFYDSNGSAEDSSMEHSGGTVEQHPTTVEETCAYFESLYDNIAIEVEKVSTVNRKNERSEC
ncbi:hypothetical protein Tco_1156098 [Tanacetum coccineum]